MYIWNGGGSCHALGYLGNTWHCWAELQFSSITSKCKIKFQNFVSINLNFLYFFRVFSTSSIAYGLSIYLFWCHWQWDYSWGLVWLTNIKISIGWVFYMLNRMQIFLGVFCSLSQLACLGNVNFAWHFYIRFTS